MTAPAPRDVVLACSRPATPPAEAERLRAAAAQIAWPEVAGLARHHGVHVLVARRLRELDVDVPAPTREFLRRAERDTVISGTIHAAETKRLVDLLDAAGVTALPLKGPTLAVAAYGDVSARRSGDLDLLVRDDEIRATEDALLRGGYRYEDGPPSDGRRRWAVRVDGQLPPMVREDNLVRLEVHRTVNQPIHRLRLDEDGMRRRARPRELGPVGPVRSMGPEDMILVICTHAGRTRWERFEWATSLARLCRTPGLDWPLVERLARRASVRRLLALALLYAHEVDPELPAEAWKLTCDHHAAKLAPRMAPLRQPWKEGEHTPPEVEGLDRRLVSFWLRSRERLRDQLSVVTWMLTPKSDDVDKAGLPPRLEFLLWPRRWLRVLGLAVSAVRR